MQENWFAVFKVKVTVRVQIIQYDCFWIFQTAGLFATKLGLIVQHHKPQCPVKNGIAVFKVRVTGKVQNVNECLSG